MQQNALEIAKEAMRILFDETWASLKRRFPERAKKVKKAFILRMSTALFAYLLDAAENLEFMQAPDCVDVINFVFHTHFFNTGYLPDDKRSEYQRSEKYQKDFLADMSERLLLHYQNLKLTAISTRFSPEIFCFDQYIDCLARIMYFATPTVTRERVGSERFSVIKSLIADALSLAKSVLLLMAESSPSHAIISWRALIELEYKVMTLTIFDDVLTERFVKFGEFEQLDEDEESPTLAEYRDYAEADKFDMRHPGYKNYGWIVGIDTQEISRPYPSLKSLFKIVGHESRYKSYKIASSFAHSSASTMEANEVNVYAFLFKEMFASLNNINNAVFKIHRQYCISFEGEAVEYHEKCTKAFNAASATFNENWILRNKETK